MSISPPRPKDLPLNALRAFEAAARCDGFAAAGQELGVSPGAVSAHVKALEATLGAALFERTARGVHLTALGRRVLPEFVAAFDALAAAAGTLRAEAAPHRVHIAALPSAAQLWLSPRLPALRAAVPEIAVSITALETAPNPKRTPFDLCLFFDEGRGVTLSDDEVFPVCAPEVAARLQGPEDLRDVTCITDTTWSDDWDIWARAAMPGVDFAPRGPVFSLYALALEEALNGAGVVMGHLPLVRDLLDRGALVAPFAARVRLPRALRLWETRAMAPRSAARYVFDQLRMRNPSGS